MAGAGLILAAPSSGSGKTLITAGLLRLLRNRGQRIPAALARHLPEVPVLGAVPNSDAFALPSRHLGLVPAGELSEHDSVLDRVADAIGAAVDIERLTGLARPARRSRSRPSRSRQGPML